MLQAVLDAGPEKAGAREHELAARALQAPGDGMAKAAALVAFLCSPACAGITGRLLSAVWDPWAGLPERRAELETSDIYTLRRIVPKDRGRAWGERA
jgi:3-oxoacyl-[acyl-carrier protein] reductase